MKRYEESISIIRHPSGVRRYETLFYPTFAYKSSDIYFISRQLDRMDLLAQEYYYDPRYWWIIQRANNLPGGTMQVPAGLQIRIPYPLDESEIQNKINEQQF